MLAAVAGGSSSAISSGGLSFTLTDNASASVDTLLTGSSSSLSPTRDVDSTSAVSSGSLLSFVASYIGSTFFVSGSGPLSPIAGCVGSASTISGVDPLSSIASVMSFMSAVSDSSSFFLVTDDSPLSLATCDLFRSVGSRALFLSSTPSYTCRLFLVSLSASLVSEAMPMTGIKLFDKAFIK